MTDKQKEKIKKLKEETKKYESMGKTTNEEIIYRLDKIIQLLAIVGSEKLTLKNQIKILTDVGFTPTQMSTITGKNTNLIRVLKHNIEKERRNLR